MSSQNPPSSDGWPSYPPSPNPYEPGGDPSRPPAPGLPPSANPYAAGPPSAYGQPASPDYPASASPYAAGSPSYPPSASPYAPGSPSYPASASPYGYAAPSAQPGYGAVEPYTGAPYGQPSGYPQIVYPTGVYPEQKSRIAAGLLAIFLGGLGIHNFYLGRTGRALAQLLISVLSLGTLLIFVDIWALIEGILILTKSPGYQTDARGVPLRD